MTKLTEKIKPLARLGGHEGRLKGDYAEDLINYSYKPLVDRTKYLFHPVIMYNKAHIVMLTEMGIIDKERSKKILTALEEVEEMGIDSIELDPKLQDIYFNIEAIIIDKTGYNVGGMLYLGRTRDDAQKVPDRISHREALLNIMEEIIEIRKASINLASDNIQTLMPSYTVLQHAQPMTFGFYMLWFIEAMETDFERLMDVYKRLNMSPGETGTGMTTSFTVSRERAAELLGFEGIIENAFYAHRSLDREIESLAILSTLMLDIYQLCEDFHIWCASDIKFMELDDKYSTTSFMMAQKKNPAGLAHPELVTITTQSAFNILYDLSKRNTSEVGYRGSRSMLFRHEATQSILGALKVMKGLISTVILHKDVMKKSVGRLFSQGTDLADTLVRECGISFREAHRVVGTLVRHAVEQGKAPEDVTVKDLSEAAKEALGKSITLKEESMKKALNPVEGIKSKKIIGGVAPEVVKEAIERKKIKIKEHEGFIKQKRNLLKKAEQKLERACAGIIGSK